MIIRASHHCRGVLYSMANPLIRDCGGDGGG